MCQSLFQARIHRCPGTRLTPLLLQTIHTWFSRNTELQKISLCFKGVLRTAGPETVRDREMSIPKPGTSTRTDVCTNLSRAHPHSLGNQTQSRDHTISTPSMRREKLNTSQRGPRHIWAIATSIMLSPVTLCAFIKSLVGCPCSPRPAHQEAQPGHQQLCSALGCGAGFSLLCLTQKVGRLYHPKAPEFCHCP